MKGYLFFKLNPLPDVLDLIHDSMHFKDFLQ